MKTSHKYPLLLATTLEFPNTVIDWEYGKVLEEKTDKLQELLNLTSCNTYQEVFVLYEGSTIEELLNDHGLL